MQLWTLFFCKKGMTSNIAHGKVSSKPKANKCSGKHETVSRRYCVVCKHDAKAMFPDCTDTELRGKVRMVHATKGCKTCGVAVCKDHWLLFEHSYNYNK